MGVRGGSKSRSQVERLKHLCARLGTADCLCQRPARPGSPEHRPGRGRPALGVFLTEKKTKFVIMFRFLENLHRSLSAVARERAWFNINFHGLLSIPLGLSRDKIWREKLFLGLVQIEINLCTLLSICTKPRKSFSHQILSLDKPSGIDNTALQKSSQN